MDPVLVVSVLSSRHDLSPLRRQAIQKWDSRIGRENACGQAVADDEVADVASVLLQQLYGVNFLLAEFMRCGADCRPGQVRVVEGAQMDRGEQVVPEL